MLYIYHRANLHICKHTTFLYLDCTYFWKADDRDAQACHLSEPSVWIMVSKMFTRVETFIAHCMRSNMAFVRHNLTTHWGTRGIWQQCQKAHGVRSQSNHVHDQLYVHQTKLMILNLIITYCHPLHKTHITWVLSVLLSILHDYTMKCNGGAIKSMYHIKVQDNNHTSCHEL